jgi:DNA-binding response OmpR family regulator
LTKRLWIQQYPFLWVKKLEKGFLVKKKVLVCEDDRTMVGLLTTLLEIEGYQVAQLDDSTEANLIDKLSIEKPDILLMDVYLRQINGLDLLRSLRDNTNFRDLRIIMTSGVNLRENCLKFGANAFILKPFMPEELMSTLRKQITN